MKKVLIFVNAIILFAVWLLASVLLATTDEWWSLYTLNMEELSPYNMEISWLKVFIFGFISFIISFVLVQLTSKKSSQNL